MKKLKKYISSKFFVFFVIIFSQSIQADQVKYNINFPFPVKDLHFDFKDLNVDMNIEKMPCIKKDVDGHDIYLSISMELDEKYPINMNSDYFINTQEIGGKDFISHSVFSGLSSKCVNEEKVVHVSIKAPEDFFSTVSARRARVASVDMICFPRVFAYEDSFISSADTKNAVGVFQSTQHIDLYDALNEFLKKKKMPPNREKEIFSHLVKEFIFSLGEIMYKPFRMIKNITVFLSKKNAKVDILQKKISALMENMGKMWEYLHENALKAAIEKSAKKTIRTLVFPMTDPSLVAKKKVSTGKIHDEECH